MTISEMKPGEDAVVVGYQGNNKFFLNRLITMGLTRGTSVRLIKRAPLGDPAEIEVRGFRLSLRVAEASVILLDRL